jgi:hypothetical protein
VQPLTTIPQRRAEGAATAAAAEAVPREPGSAPGVAAADSDDSSAVLVSADGCSLAPGAVGVRVVDYIAAKYSFHFPDAGKGAQ